MKKPLFYVIALLLVIIFLFTGCKEGTKLKKNSIALDDSKMQSATVNDLEGAHFQIESGKTTATVVAMPGVFPAGTNVSVTPLSKDKGLKGEKLSAFYELKAVHEGKIIQPSMPVFVTLAVETDLPESACIVVYDDGESVGYEVDSEIVREDGISYVTAELNHFSIIGVGKKGSGTRKNTKSSGEWEEWRFVANGPAKEFTMVKDDEVWEFKANMRLTAVNRSGKITGRYYGKPVITITGKMKEGVVPKEVEMVAYGDLKLTLTGDMEFLLTSDPSGKANIPTELRPGDPTVDVGEFLQCFGSMDMSGEGNFDFGIVGPKVLPDAQQQGGGGGTRMQLFYISVNKNGAQITFGGIGKWDAVMVGVPKGGLPGDRKGEDGEDYSEPGASSGSTDSSDPSGSDDFTGFFNFFGIHDFFGFREFFGPGNISGYRYGRIGNRRTIAGGRYNEPFRQLAGPQGMAGR